VPRLPTHKTARIQITVSHEYLPYVGTAKMLIPAVANDVANPAQNTADVEVQGARAANLGHRPSALTPVNVYNRVTAEARPMLPPLPR
jgi:hypothetical protein